MFFIGRGRGLRQRRESFEHWRRRKLWRTRFDLWNTQSSYSQGFDRCKAVGNWQVRSSTLTANSYFWNSIPVTILINRARYGIKVSTTQIWATSVCTQIISKYVGGWKQADDGWRFVRTQNVYKYRQQEKLTSAWFLTYLLSLICSYSCFCMY